MKYLYHGMGLLLAFSLMFAFLITSVEAVVYFNEDYFAKEYRKHKVLQRVDMRMSDLLTVTDEMMAYLKGERSDLVVETTIGGEKTEFFNAKEKRHMVDVQGLFLGGQRLRLAALLLVCGLGTALLLCKKGLLLLRMLQWGVGLFLAGMGMLAVLVSTDFTKYFTWFHLIFFDNDDWLLNPKTDRLINIVPEGFFRDTAFFITGIFLTTAFIIWLAAGLLRKKGKNRGTE